MICGDDFFLFVLGFDFDDDFEIYKVFFGYKFEFKTNGLIRKKLF